MRGFIKNHPVAAPVAAVAGLITVASFANEAYTLVNAGLPNLVWAAMAAAAFVVSVLSVVFKQHEAIEELQQRSRSVARGSDMRSAPPPRETRREKPRPNYRIWRQRDDYMIEELAALLADSDPAFVGADADRAGYRRLAIEAAQKGKLPYERIFLGPHEQAVDMNTRIKREDAITWAEANGFDVSKLK